MRKTAVFQVLLVGLIALGLGLGCKKKEGEKKGGGDEAMTAEAMTAEAMTAEAMEAADPRAGEAGEAERPAVDPRETAEVEPPEAEPVPEDKEAVAEGVISEAKGTVEIRRAGKTDFEEAAKDTHVFAKDSVRVGKDGEATVTLWDNSTIELPPETAITVNVSEAIADPAPSVTVMAGAARFDVTPRTEGQGPFSIMGPSAAVSVQGTTLVVGVGLSGATRIGVEAGTVELVPVAQIDIKPVAVPQGRVVLVPYGQPASAPAPYAPAKAGWDEWLEEEDTLGDKTEALAALHAGQVEALNKDAETLNAAAHEAEGQTAQYREEAQAAEKQADAKAYLLVQPKIEDSLEAQFALRSQRQLSYGRLMAHSYLLSLMHARLRAGVYEAPPAVMAKVERDYLRAMRMSEHRRRASLLRYRAERPRMVRWKTAYYRHHHRGRAVAPKLKVHVPPFYVKTRLAPRPRPAQISVAGWDRPVYRRPVYRGRRLPYRPPVVAVHPGAPMPAVPVFRVQAWDRGDHWRAVQQRRMTQQRAQREVFRKAVVQRRAERWTARPDTRKFHRAPAVVRPRAVVHGPRVRDPRSRDPRVRDPRVRDPRVRDPRVRDPHHMGPPPHGVGPGPRVRDPRVRDPHHMGPPPHGVGPGPRVRDPRVRDPHPMGPGPRGPAPMVREPRVRDPHPMGPGPRGPAPMVREPRGAGPQPGRPGMPAVRVRGMDR